MITVENAWAGAGLRAGFTVGVGVGLRVGLRVGLWVGGERLHEAREGEVVLLGVVLGLVNVRVKS